MTTNQETPYRQMILDCEAAIARARELIRAGRMNDPQVGEALMFVLHAVEIRLIGYARRVADLGPEAFEEALEALNDRLIDDMLSPGYVTLETQFGAYLKTRPFRVLQEVARKYGRSGVSSPVARLDHVSGEGDMTLAEQLPDLQTSALLDQLATREMLQSALNQLPADERYVLRQRLAGVDNNTIARQLSVSAATATRVYQRALATMRRLHATDGETNVES